MHPDQVEENCGQIYIEIEFLRTKLLASTAPAIKDPIKFHISLTADTALAEQCYLHPFCQYVYVYLSTETSTSPGGEQLDGIWQEGPS